MRFNKQIAVILILSSLLISAIGAALFLYYENEKTKKANESQLTVYVAKKDIKKDTLIKEEDIKKAVVAKRYLLTKPLLKKEIVNKFAKTSIYPNEMFRKEKLSKEIGQSNSVLLVPKFNSYNTSFKLFENPNYSLLKGDIINIVSVYPKSKDKKNMKYKVNYVAKQIRILGFLERGKIVEKGFKNVKKKIKSKNKKETIPKYELVKVFASEVILDMSDKTILSMIDDYNKGKQLWMVKTSYVKKVKKAIKAKPKKKQKRARKFNDSYALYLPKNLSKTHTATIEYKDALIPDVSKKAVLSSNVQQQCIDENKVLIGIANEVLLRSMPSTKGKIKKVLHKNHIIPYKRKVNSSWFEVCDGRYVHKYGAKIIDYKKAQDLLDASSTKK